MKVKKYLFLLVLFFAAFIYSAILLIRLKLWYILIVSSIIFFGISFMALELGLLNMRGDWMGNVDLSLVDKTWIKIPSTATTNDFYWGATYKQKNESEVEVSKPYVILAHGMGSGLEELEMMAAPLALTGYHVIAFNQTGHGFGNHMTPGPGRDYTLLMPNIHDVVEYVDKLPDCAKDSKGAARIGFIGASTGGIMALTHAYSNSKIRCIVALSHIHDYRELLSPQSQKGYGLFSIQRLFKTMLKLMKVKLDYTEEENKMISPKYFLRPDPKNKDRLYLVHCKDDPLPFAEALKSKALAELPDENCLFLETGGHGFRAQETTITAVISKWLEKSL